LKLLKDWSQVLGRNSDALVPNRNDPLAVRLISSDCDRLAIAVLDRIGNQIGDRLVDSQPIPRTPDIRLEAE
jgi:hypothetical protein